MRTVEQHALFAFAVAVSIRSRRSGRARRARTVRRTFALGFGRRARTLVDLDDNYVLAYFLHALPRHEQVLVFGKYPALAVRDNYALDLAAIARKNNIGDVAQTFAVAAVYDLESAQFAKR